MFEIMDNGNDHSEEAVIKVIGVGGGGGNAVQHMITDKIEGVQFITINTDAQALRSSEFTTTLQIGSSITKGLGAGANPEVGRNAALEDADKIRAELEGADMLFIAAGMGGGTGTGAAPVVAEIAKELGILTVAVVTRPFGFEGKKRSAYAQQGLDELGKSVDSLITIPNDKLLKVLGRGVSLLDAFREANNVLHGAVQGISELITRPGMMNVDFADVRTVMSEMGTAMMGTGAATGDNRAEEAADKAIASPLLEDVDLAGARGILVNVTAGFDMTIEEFETIGNAARAYASDIATVVVGTVLDPDLSDEIRVTMVATGIGGERKPDITLVPNLGVESPRAEPQVQVKPAPVVQSKPAPVAKSAPATEQSRPAAATATATKTEEDTEIFDIPAFLRRQAD